jgi:hypothetical protein
MIAILTILLLFWLQPQNTPTNVQVGPLRVSVQVTHTQAILNYTAPDANACTLKVSEDRKFAALVPDVDTALFSGSSADDRTGNITTGTARTFVVGRQGMGVPYGGTNEWLAGDDIIYSRALRANTAHYFKLTCGTTIQTGSFITANTPMGLTWQPGLPNGATAGTYNFPTWPTSRTGANSTIIDPFTGVLLRPVSLAADSSLYYATWPSSALHNNCSPVTYLGGRLCINQLTRISDNETMSWGALYWVHPTQPAVYLGRPYGASNYCSPMPCAGSFGTYLSGDSGSPAWSNTTWNVMYTTVQTRWHPTACSEGTCRHVLAKLTFSGALTTVAADTETALTVTLLQTPWAATEQSLVHDWNAFDSRFPTDGTLSDGGVSNNAAGGSDKYLIIVSRRWTQDSYGMMSAWDISSTPATIVGSADVSKVSGCRWCGIHAPMNIWDSSPALTAWRPTDLDSYGDSGPWGVHVWSDAGHTAGLAAGTTEVYVDGEPACLNATQAYCYGVTGASDTFLMNAATGDLLVIGSEIVKVASKESATHWHLQRAFGGTAASHSAGAVAQMKCEAWDVTGAYYKMGYWAYTSDALGASISYDASGASAGHMEARPSGRLNEAWGFVSGLNASLDAAQLTRQLTRNPGFAGQTAGAPGNAYTVWGNSESASPNGLWFTDMGKTTGGVNGGISDGSSATLVSGFSNVWKFGGSTTFPLNKHYAHFGFADTVPLKERSGPSVSLTDKDLNTFCIANASNECVTGSSAGDIYIVVVRDPGTQQMTCTFSYNNLSYGLCVGNVWANVNSMVQQGVAATDSCSGSPVPTCGPERFRIFQTLSSAYAKGPLSSGVKPFTDGTAVASYANWAWDSKVPEGRFLLAIPPPFPTTVETSPLSTYLSETITVPNVSGTYPTVHNAIIKFGYRFNGGPTDFYCSQRQESCYRAAQASNGWDYASAGAGTAGSGITGVSCATGCTITLPVIPYAVAYYQIVYRNSSNATLGTSTVAVKVGR